MFVWTLRTAVQRGGGETCRAQSGSPLEAVGTVCPGRVAGAGPVAGPLRPHSALFRDIDSTLSQGDEDEPVRVLIFLDGALATFSLKLPGRALLSPRSPPSRRAEGRRCAVHELLGKLSCPASSASCLTRRLPRLSLSAFPVRACRAELCPRSRLVETSVARPCALAQRSSPKLPPTFPGAQFPLDRDAPGHPIPVFILAILKVFGAGPFIPKELLLT